MKRILLLAALLGGMRAAGSCFDDAGGLTSDV
jgi:hypothetical protein